MSKTYFHHEAATLSCQSFLVDKVAIAAYYMNIDVELRSETY